MEQQTPNTDFSKNAVHINFDDFEISENSFKPVTKGLGFHHEQKRQHSFRSAPKEIKNNTTQKSLHPLLNDLATNNQKKISTNIPSGLEAFYGKPTEPKKSDEIKLADTTTLLADSEIQYIEKKNASIILTFAAWIIDLLVVFSFSIITTTLLIWASGINFNTFLRIVPMEDTIVFSAVLFSIYYMLYFTILELNGTPGKTIFGLRLITINNRPISVRHTFIRSIVSLLSFVALFLPMLVDFQGRLSETKVTK
jgi:uncharacterized RDD family membrane protein YckC